MDHGFVGDATVLVNELFRYYLVFGKLDLLGASGNSTMGGEIETAEDVDAVLDDCTASTDVLVVDHVNDLFAADDVPKIEVTAADGLKIDVEHLVVGNVPQLRASLVVLDLVAANGDQ